MIFLNHITEDRKGINFGTLEDTNVVIKIIDGYTGLCTYSEDLSVTKGYSYFFSHPVNIKHRRFEIWNQIKDSLLLRIDIVENSYLDLSIQDTLGKLKNFKYNNPIDKDPGLPLYEIFCTGIYDRGICSIEADDIVFDIGGNLGLFSYYAIGKNAKEVHCFEPSQSSFSCIKENFLFLNLYINNTAVSTIDGEINFFISPTNSINSSAVISQDNSEIVTCKSINLNTYIITNNIQKIDYLKMDCEGSEYEIIESLSEEYLTNSIQKICLEYHLNKNGKLLLILDKLKRCGFTIQFEFSSEQINDELGIFYAWKK